MINHTFIQHFTFLFISPSFNKECTTLEIKHNIMYTPCLSITDVRRLKWQLTNQNKCCEIYSLVLSLDKEQIMKEPDLYNSLCNA